MLTTKQIEERIAIFASKLAKELGEANDSACNPCDATKRLFEKHKVSIVS